MSTTTTTPIPAGTWTVDPAHSKVGFAVKHMGIATVRGEFTEFEGTLEIGEDLSTAQGLRHGQGRSRSTPTSPSATITCARPTSSTPPSSRSFASSRRDRGARRRGVPDHRQADDPRRDQRRSSLHADVQGTDIDPWGNERVGLEVTGQLSRGDYGMKFNQALGSGNMLVADKVKLALDISAVKQSAYPISLPAGAAHRRRPPTSTQTLHSHRLPTAPLAPPSSPPGVACSRPTRASPRSSTPRCRPSTACRLSAYEVLMFLDDAPEHRMRMSEIADRVLLSRSGCTRLVDRLCEQGYVTRCAATSDGRGLYAQLTEAGLEKISAARATHREGIRRCFLDHLTATDQIALGDIWTRLR